VLRKTSEDIRDEMQCLRADSKQLKRDAETVKSLIIAIVELLDVMKRYMLM